MIDSKIHIFRFKICLYTDKDWNFESYNEIQIQSSSPNCDAICLRGRIYCTHGQRWYTSYHRAALKHLIVRKDISWKFASFNVSRIIIYFHRRLVSKWL